MKTSTSFGVVRLRPRCVPSPYLLLLRARFRPRARHGARFPDAKLTPILPSTFIALSDTHAAQMPQPRCGSFPLSLLLARHLPYLTPPGLGCPLLLPTSHSFSAAAPTWRTLVARRSDSPKVYGHSTVRFDAPTPIRSLPSRGPWRATPPLTPRLAACSTSRARNHGHNPARSVPANRSPCVVQQGPGTPSPTYRPSSIIYAPWPFSRSSRPHPIMPIHHSPFKYSPFIVHHSLLRRTRGLGWAISCSSSEVPFVSLCVPVHG